MIQKRKCRFAAISMAVVMASTVLGSSGFGNTVYAEEQQKTKTFPDKYTQDLVQPISDDSVIEEKVEALIKTMTVDEKFTFLGGNGTGQEGNAGDLPGVARLGVPRIKMYDGPAGLLFTDDTTNPPQEQMLAATWDEEMANLYGEMYSQENLAMGGTMMLSAELDIQRHPFWSRTKDQMGEDPYLLSSLSDDMVKGMQSQGGIAVLKHYAVASDDGDLINKMNQNVDEQTLHELYLPGFETAVKEGGALGIMTAYNRTNGERSSQNHYLLLDVLRNMWKYNYFTITDWGGNHTFTMNDGTDIEMPALDCNSKANADKLVANGTYTQKEMDDLIDNAVRHILNAYGKSGYLTLVEVDKTTGLALEDPSKKDAVIDVAADKASLAAISSDSDAKVQEVAEEGAVLLKNKDNALPIKKNDDSEKVAVIGTNGMILIPGTGGERSYGRISSMTSPYDALVSILGEDRVDGQIYTDVVGEIIPNENLYTAADGDTHGAIRTYGTGKSAESGDVVQGQFVSNSVPEQAMEGHAIGEIAATDEVIDFNTNTKTYVNGDGGTAFSYQDRPAYTWETYVEAPEDGEYEIVLQSIGAEAAMSVYKITLKNDQPVDGKYDYSASNIEHMRARKGTASGASKNQGTQWYNNSTFPSETGENLTSVRLNMKAGERYKVCIASANSLDGKDMQVGLAWITPSKRKANVDNAIQAAKDNKKVVVFAYAGTSSLGSSAADTSLKLPESQQKMINDVAKAAHDNGNKVIVVLQNSAAIVMEDWIDNVDAILDIYYPGQRGGVATARLLTGEVNPSGKLAFTIPKNDSDTFITHSEEAFNAFQTKRDEDYTDEDDGLTFGGPGGPGGGFPGGGFPGGGTPGGEEDENAEYDDPDFTSGGSSWMGSMLQGTYDMNYSEGIFTGYRWYDKEGVEPQYDFGYGLSYTTFKYSDMKVSKAVRDDEKIGYDVTFKIKNTGDVTGSEVAQIYLGEAEVPDGIQMAKYQLAGFQKVKNIKPGETRRVTIHVSERALSYWNVNQETLNVNSDGTQDKWTVAEGERTIYVGAASDNLLLEKTVQVKGEETKNASSAELKDTKEQLAKAQAELKAAKESYDALSKSKVTVSQVTQMKPVSKKKKQINVSWNAESGASGYEVQYSLKKNMKNAVTKTVKGNKTKLTLKKLKSKKKYYIRVRAYKDAENGMIVYGAYSKADNVKVK